MLPESVRNSVLQRINSSGFDMPQIEQSESILLEDEEEEEAIEDEKDDSKTDSTGADNSAKRKTIKIEGQ